MKNYYEIEKGVNKIYNGESTFFLDRKEQLEVKKKLKKTLYNIYYPYIDSEKVIFYVNKKPKIVLFEIITSDKLTHQDIMGSIFSLGISKNTFGDIIIDNNKYYFYTLESLKDYFLLNFTKIRSSKIILKELDINYLKDYKRKYEEYTIVVSSERIDTIISRIICVNREKVKEKVKNKEIILNYDIVKNVSKNLNPGDIFSIRKYGKFKYGGIIYRTKKDNFVIKYYKYI